MARGGGSSGGGGSFGGGRSGGGGSFGGGRSGGGSFGRSSGGSFGGRSGASGGSFGGSRKSSGGSGGSKSYGRPTSSGGREYSGGKYYGGSAPSGGSHGGSGGNRGGGCFGCGGIGFGAVLVAIAVFILIAIIATAAQSCSSGSVSSGEITTSTVEREKLASYLVTETGYYTDTTGSFISSTSDLTAGLRSFYAATGVQPYVYITDNISGDYAPEVEALGEYADVLYAELFTDEGHLLLLLCIDVQGASDYASYYILTGTSAATVIDGEARDILADYLNAYYDDLSLSNEEFISNAFRDAGERIMHVERSAWPYVLIVLGIIIILIVLFVWWKKHKEQKNREAEQTERILNTPIQKFGDAEAEELAKKYGPSDGSGS